MDSLFNGWDLLPKDCIYNLLEWLEDSDYLPLRLVSKKFLSKPLRDTYVIKTRSYPSNSIPSIVTKGKLINICFIPNVKNLVNIRKLVLDVDVKSLEWVPKQITHLVILNPHKVNFSTIPQNVKKIDIKYPQFVANTSIKDILFEKFHLGRFLRKIKLTPTGIYVNKMPPKWDMDWLPDNVEVVSFLGDGKFKCPLKLKKLTVPFLWEMCLMIWKY